MEGEYACNYERKYKTGEEKKGEEKGGVHHALN